MNRGKRFQDGFLPAATGNIYGIKGSFDGVTRSPGEAMRKNENL
jgi:hypothetical protein